MSGVHARLSASSAHRWLQCPPSALHKSERGSQYAATGTYAHDIAAQCLNDNSLQPSDFLLKKAKVDGFDVECDLEMVEGVNLYLDEVAKDLKQGDLCWVEMSLLQALAKIDPDLGGTADYVRYRPSTKHLLVVDFKYGSGVFVDADSNEQLMLYALGAMLECGKAVTDVTVRVIQPRFEGANPVRDWSFKAHEIMDFVADVREAAEKSRDEKTPRKAGDHCKFCPAARTCPELERHTHEITLAEFGAEQVSVPAGKGKTEVVLAPKAGVPVDYDVLAKALASIPLVKERIRQIEEFAYAQAVKGATIPGFKLVDKQASRKWKSEDAVIHWAKQNAIDPYAPPEILSPAQFEKKLAESAPRGQKGKQGERIEALVERVSSGTALVPEADKRQAVKVIAATDFEVIEQVSR